ncbi:ABC transporter ATP-binding protein [Anaerococcus sp. AGMB09787]|uniref:amino acid ABC transporter ATP-binding/permease protein n=1 Tax=Anaerococcus sp. AGMB09787 TaxID=2922869 RepID=UPI001FAED302|nr:ABC transporter ATP-binding protein [Anaerococcus sp. AGMB09787]
MNTRKRSDFQIMKKLIRLVSPLKYQMLVAILAGSISLLFFTGIGVLAGSLVFTYFSEGILSKFVIFSIIIAVILRGVFRYLEQYMNHLIAFKVLVLLRNKVFGAVMRLAPSKIENTNKGDLISMISSDMELLEVFYAHTISPVCIALVSAIIYVAYLGSIFPLGGFILLLGYILIGLVLPIIFERLADPVAFKIRKNIGGLNNNFLDLLRGIGEIITFSYQDKDNKKVQKIGAKLNKNQGQLVRQLAFLLALVDFLKVSISLIIIISAIATGQSTYVVFISAIFTYFSLEAVKAVALLGNGLSQTLACGDRILTLLEEEPAVMEIKGKNDLSLDLLEESKNELIKIEGLNFSYGDKKILKDFNLSIAKNQIVGIKGPSGCGKSTLLKLIIRFWEADSGKIEIANLDIADINTKSLYEHISYMTQTTELFEGSIRDNLLIAKNDASDEEIRDALRKAAILDYVEGLKEGLDTFTRELGDNFSSGQMQRLGLARCFLKNAPILLLDEPTSNLDSLNENIILTSIKNNMKDKTIIMVSHRASSLIICDKIINMKGKN